MEISYIDFKIIMTENGKRTAKPFYLFVWNAVH